jgi:hypothetical protein
MASYTLQEEEEDQYKNWTNYSVPNEVWQIGYEARISEHMERMEIRSSKANPSYQANALSDEDS